MKLVWLDSRPAGTQEGNTVNTVQGRLSPLDPIRFPPGHAKIPPTLKTPLSDEMFVPP
jgi:hypothetical protein